MLIFYFSDFKNYYEMIRKRKSILLIKIPFKVYI